MPLSMFVNGDTILLQDEGKTILTILEEASEAGVTLHFDGNLISETVAENQLFFSVACAMKDMDCIAAMRWFRECMFFSRGRIDVINQLANYGKDRSMLNAMSDYAKSADVGVEDMRLEVKDSDPNTDSVAQEELSSDVDTVTLKLFQALNEYRRAK